MMSSLPSQYVLATLLLPTWLHPSHTRLWKATRTLKTLVFGWSPTVVPALTDPKIQLGRPNGNTACQECKSFCTGHYLKPDQQKELAMNGDVVPSNKPPRPGNSRCLQAAQGDTFRGLSVWIGGHQVLLHPDEVQMWLKHLQSVSENRKEGARKAAQKRRKACWKGTVLSSCFFEQPLYNTSVS